MSENPLAKQRVDRAESKEQRRQAAQQLETSILENSLNKICSLLSVSGGREWNSQGPSLYKRWWEENSLNQMCPLFCW